jgi:hypothetical protein
MIELHPKLKAAIQKTKLFTMIHHPLVVMAPFQENIDVLVEQANNMLEHKTAALIEAREKKDWSSYVWLHERPYRLQGFLEIHNLIPEEEYWPLFGQLWMDTEYPHINLKVWSELWSRPGAHQTMSWDELKVLAALPTRVHVYRGMAKRGDKGLSWTTKKEVAEFFARRFNPNGGKVAHAHVPKHKIRAWLDGRSEGEVIIVNQVLGVRYL